MPWIATQLYRVHLALWILGTCTASNLFYNLTTTLSTSIQHSELPNLVDEYSTTGKVSPRTTERKYSGCNARATLDKQSCVITSMLFEMNSTYMRWCDLNFSCLSTSITSAEVSSCQDKRRYPNPIWPTVFTFRVFKLSFCEFMTMVSLHVHKSTLKC